MGCSQLGKASIEKKVPDNKNCGKVTILEIGGTILSFFAIPEMIKPKPINTIMPRVERISILTTVKAP